MTAAAHTGVPGIVGQCGENRACATHYVHIDADWFGLVGPAGPEERGLTELTEQPSPLSRLSWQFTIAAKLDGLTMTSAP